MVETAAWGFAERSTRMPPPLRAFSLREDTGAGTRLQEKASHLRLTAHGSRVIIRRQRLPRRARERQSLRPAPTPPPLHGKR
ncbi:hypothetical protein SKAU_G00324730 [Synaphobranchus kaupii]|uniref:Uncharacterized protein n=1 Tax=Synaphobranchus kaupii TaxID=118154 RepID=A0A9Q1EPC4_SYNKA|nr:hypothetical protein SKAU_G00324730 [Synaphobranchus kaupii]